MSKVPYDKLYNMTQPRMATEIGKIIERMNVYYGDLNGKQAEYMSMDPTACLGLYVTHICRCDVHVFGIYTIWCVHLRPCDKLKESVTKLFASCTKDDVTLNNYITRSKLFG